MIKVGDRAEVSRKFESEDISDYASLSGYEQSRAQVPEPLLAGMVSDLLGTRLPGGGTMYMKQQTEFHGSAPVGEQIRASVEVTQIREDKLLVNLKTQCCISTGEIISSGEALVMFPGLASDSVA